MINNSSMKILAFAAIVLLSFPGAAQANLELPWLLRDGAVLQQNKPIPIRGTSPANTTVAVKFGEDEQQTRSDAKGNWQTTFPGRKAGGPYQLSVTSGNDSITVSDILIGDVWVASGQSNMEWPLGNTDGAEAEISSTRNEQIRHFKVPKSWAVTPSDTLAGGQWLSAAPETLPEFSGVAWYFAKKVHAETGIPIGIINTTWGGSNIESWMSSSALGTAPEAAAGRIEKMISEGESRAEAVKKSLQRWPEASVKEVKNANADWSAPNIGEDDWAVIEAPSLWEQQGYQGVDGVIWYRKSFTLNEAEAEGDVILGLGRIDDNDITWVNGTEVGRTNAYDMARTYQLPAKILKTGINQIAIRVEDTGGGGGIYSNDDLLYFQTADGKQHSLAGKWKIKPDKVSVAMLSDMNHTDTALYNKMLHPLFSIPVKGVLWYQGESNANTAGQAEKYRQQFKALISDWREQWNNPAMPFYWVQLASFDSKQDTEDASPWAILRESQTAALTLENTGQAITIDVGDPTDIHPRDKKTVGERLARIALNQTYGYNKVHFRGPRYESFAHKGDQLVLEFASTSRLLTSDKSKTVKGFEIAGEDGKFKPINGKIKRNKVVILLSDGKMPVSLRYAWSDNPGGANLVDRDGLPAEPFRLNL